jgi:hypothetical protein
MSVYVNDPGNSVNVNPTFNTVNVIQDQNSTIVEVITPGPQGPQGEPGDVTLLTGSFVSTGSFNTFTASYYADSASFSASISDLQDFSSSLTATFVTEAELNAITRSFATTGSNQFNGNQTITGSLTISGSSTFTNIGPAVFSGSVTVTQGGITGSLQGTSSFAINTSQAISSSQAISASYALTASFASNVPQTASYAISASQAINANTSSFQSNIQFAETHIPFFDSDTSMSSSAMRQSGSNSIIINREFNTANAPEALFVYQPDPDSFNIITAEGNVDNYVQINIKNENSGSISSADVVATADNGNEFVNYVNMGINSSTFTGSVGGPNDAYLYSTGNDLTIGNATANKHVRFFTGGGLVDVYQKLILDPNNLHELTGSLSVFNGVITSSLFGTASFANNALSASYALNTTSASYALTASFASNVPQTASYAISASQAISSSFASNVLSSSYANNSTSASYSLTASYADNIPETASFAVSASQAISSSFASNALSSSYSLTASYALDSNINTGSFAITGSNIFSGSQGISGSLNVSGGLNVGSYISSSNGGYFGGQIYVSDLTIGHGGNTNNTNTAIGFNALQQNISGFNNTALGYQTLLQNTSGSNNVALGTNTLLANTSGSFNTAIGSNTLSSNTTGSLNTALGHNAGFFATGSGNVFLGNSAGALQTTGDNQLWIANSSTLTPLIKGDFAKGILQLNTPSGSQITGSLVVSNGITGSLEGTASYASFANTASFALNFNPSATASYAISASNAISASRAISASYAATSSYADNFTVAGTLTAQTINVQVITSSIDYVTGSTIFGSQLTNTHQFTGSVTITGSLAVNNSNVVLTNQTSSMSVASASFAISASQATTALNAVTASYVNPLNQQVIITGSLIQGLEGNIATGEQSHAEGSITKAIGNYSHAEGDNTQAKGDYSHAEGQETLASGSYSHAEGYNTISSGSYSHAEGDSTQAIGIASHAEGGGTNASGIGSHAEGIYTQARGAYSHAEGNNAFAVGTGSHAEGNSTATIGDYSHTEGYGTQASSSYTHAEGWLTSARGIASHAEGSGSVASGIASHAEGHFTVALGDYQHVQGQYNISSSAQSAFIIGNGTDLNNRSNLVFASGSEFQVTGSIGLTGRIKSTGSLILQPDVNDIRYLEVYNTSPTDTHITASGGQIFLGNDKTYVKVDNYGTVDRIDIVADNGVNISGSLQLTGSLDISGSLFVLNTITGSLLGTASFALNANTASYFITSSVTSASFAQSASYALSASQAQNSNTAISASHALNANNAISSSFAISASQAQNANIAISSSQAQNANNAISASYALSASQAQNANNALTSSYSLNINGATNHIPLFNSQNSLVTSAIYQSNSYSIIINQDNNTTAAPEALYVWQPSTSSYNVISGKGNLNNYLQLNIQNTNNGVSASSDVVATANNGNETTNYIDMGINGANFSGPIGEANDAYLYSTGRHLHIGNISDYPIQFFAGGDDTDANRKLLLSSSNLHELTGSLEITENLSVIGSITGSLLGTASFANSATTASFALNFNPNATASFAISASQATNSNNAVTASYVLNAISASYALNATSASYAQNADLLDGKDSSEFATTGSNVFRGDQIVTGSLKTSGSNTLVGNTSLTGSLTISGSTVQIGNNTLLGNTLLSGSLTISGSIPGSTTNINIYGDTSINGAIKFLPVAENIDTSVSASYIYVSGSTQDLYFSQNGSGYNNVTRLRWLEGNLYTGLLHGGIITSQSSTVYQISSGSGIIVNLNASLGSDPYPTIQYLNWGNLSASIAPLSASYDQAFVGIQSNGTIYQQGTPFSDGQFDTLINIGIVLFQNHSTINGFKTQPSTAYGFEQNQNIFNRAFGPLKLSGYTLAPSASSTGSLVVGSGTAYSPGSNYPVDPNNPSYATDSGTTTSKIFRYYQSGSEWVYLTNGGAGYATIDPTKYSLNGTLTTVGGANWSIQRCFWYPNSVTKAIVVYYGNSRYPTEAEARANIPFESFTEAPNTAANAIYLGAIVINGTGVFTTPGDYTIYPGGLFRSVGGSGGGGSTVTTTLAGLSDVSISGQTNLQPLVYSTTAGKWINSSNISGSLYGNAQTATTASYALTVVSASYANNSTSASYALTASFALNVPVTASYAISASQATNANNAVTASYALTATSASHAINADSAITSSFALTAATASYVLNAVSASYALNATNASTASYVLNAVSSSYALSASQAQNAVSASYAQTATSSSYAATSSYADNFTIKNHFTFDATFNDYATIASTISGTNNLFTQPTGSFTSAFFKYTVKNSTNARTGEVMAVWNGANVEFTDASTRDLGNTSPVTMSVILAGSDIEFNAITNTSGWSVKSLATFM